MRLYQALTQITVDEQLFDDAPFSIEIITDHPLHNSIPVLYQYIDATLSPGSHHKENNLSFVSDPVFINTTFDFDQHDFTKSLTTVDARADFSRNLVEDLNRHLTVNFLLKTNQVQLVFAD